MKEEERNRTMYGTFRMYLKAAQKAALTHTDIPDFNGIWMILMAMVGIVFKPLGKWGWGIGIMPMLWAHAMLNYLMLFTTKLPHKRVVEADRM
eukprot:12278010-Ditylum_brightwellii.AAC.1